MSPSTTKYRWKWWNSKTVILNTVFYQCVQSHVQGLGKLCYWNRETRCFFHHDHSKLPYFRIFLCLAPTTMVFTFKVRVTVPCITIRNEMAGCIPRDTSLISSAAAWQPWTSTLVQVDRSRCVSTLKRCISMPCRDPVLVANVRSDPSEGDRHPEPEWTNLGPQTEQRSTVINALSEGNASNLCQSIHRKL